MDPIIESLITSGAAYIDVITGKLIGIAADGVELSLGFIDEATTLAYLAEYPTPDTW